MKLEKTDLIKSNSRKPFFDGDDLDSANYTFNCIKCNESVIVDCRSIYRGAWEWKKNYSLEESQVITSFFSLPDNKSKSQTHGWPSISMHQCSSCKSKYVFLADFHEYRNSVYQITAQAAGYVKN